MLKTTQNGHLILKVTYETNTGFIQNPKLALFRVMRLTESLILAHEQIPLNLSQWQCENYTVLGFTPALNGRAGSLSTRRIMINRLLTSLVNPDMLYKDHS